MHVEDCHDVWLAGKRVPPRPVRPYWVEWLAVDRLKEA